MQFRLLDAFNAFAFQRKEYKHSSVHIHMLKDIGMPTITFLAFSNFSSGISLAHVFDTQALCIRDVLSSSLFCWICDKMTNINRYIYRHRLKMWGFLQFMTKKCLFLNILYVACNIINLLDNYTAADNVSIH